MRVNVQMSDETYRRLGRVAAFRGISIDQAVADAAQRNLGLWEAVARTRKSVAALGSSSEAAAAVASDFRKAAKAAKLERTA